MEKRQCKQCQLEFLVYDDELAFLQRKEIPLPTLCPDDRRRLRLSFRNDRKLYRRKCDLCQKTIISVYDENAPFPVYCSPCWWSDKWDASIFGRKYDEAKPFFEQWNELNKIVPHIALWQIQNENCEFSHDTSYNKNCYMLFGADYNRDSFYSWSLIRDHDVCDCAAAFESERLYECTDCLTCQFCTYSQLLRNSSSCHFCFDLINSHNCFGSSGLRNKSFYFFNEPLSQEEYNEKMKTIDWTSNGIWENTKKWYEASLSVPRRYVQQRNCEESTGSYMGNCKNVRDGFDTEECRDCSSLLLGYQCKDCRDAEILYYAIEVVYNCQTLIRNCFNVFFSYFVRDLKESYYCNECYASQKLFGCVGLRNKKHCILNKQYSQTEYEELVGKIIEQMKKMQEYGEFFPATFTPFAYNDTSAVDYLDLFEAFPKEKAIEYGFRWKDEDPKTYQPQTYAVPANIAEVPDSICSEVLACSQCAKNFKIIPQELNFYRNMKLPIPHRCFDCRHKARLLRRGPRKLFERTCGKCNMQIKSSYSPGRPEIVYCEKCYLETIY
ncbi:hypothetical protein HZC21_04540 [Candidatus Peregrinibacteria bacterium]|nr:hypothetical protein [Candidatus Peregrinibacteria bacterium]